MREFGVCDMTSHEGMCHSVASLVGGDCCVAGGQCAKALTREQLRDLVYRRGGSQLFSPAAVVTKALDARPPRPSKSVTAMSAMQSRLLSHFRDIASDDVGSFFALPTPEFAKCDEPWFIGSFVKCFVQHAVIVFIYSCQFSLFLLSRHCCRLLATDFLVLAS